MRCRGILALALASWFVFLGLPAGVHAQDFQEPSSPTLTAIDAAQQRGEISDGEAMLYKLYFVHGSSLLPKSMASHGDFVRCATPILMEARMKMNTYPLAIRQEMATLMQRPVLNAYIDTAHFRIHYSTTGSNTIYGWPNTSYRDSVMAAAEKSWHFDHVVKTWQAPPSDGTNGGGSGLIDLYVDDLGTAEYGYTESEDPVSGPFPYAYTAFFVIDNDYQGFGYTDRTLPMKVTVAHEYHHVVQMGYTVGNGWWMENLSTFIEDEVYDEINDNYQYIGCFTSQPYKKHSTTNGCFEYGAFLWPTFIKENWDHALLPEIQYCAATGTIFNCFDSVLANHGGSYATALAEWAVWNFYTYLRDDGRHYLEGAGYHYYLGFDKEITSYPVPDTHPTSTKVPEATGTSVQRFKRDIASADNQLTVNYSGPACTQQVVVIAKEAGGATFHEYYMNLNANGAGSVDVPHWDTCEFAHLIVSLPRTCGSGTFDYIFSATTTVVVGVSANPPLYARTIQLDQNTPNPFGPETRISYRLDQGGPVNLSVFDASGRQVRTLIHASETAGEHMVRWDGRDDAGHASPCGVYFYRLNSEGQSQVRKLIIAP